MYTYKQAVGVNRLVNRGEELLDISKIPTRDLSSRFDRLQIIITDGIANIDVVLKASDYVNDFNSYSGLIADWLITKKNVNLKTSNTLPGLTYRFVTTHDIQYEGFSLKPGDVSRGDDAQDLLTTANANEIRVVKTDNTDVNFKEMVRRSLWTINGHFVRAVEGTRCIYLLNAGKHYRVNDDIHVNALNFNTVSTLSTHEIVLGNISFENKDTYRFLHYKSPVSLKDKTVFMVIGGRIYFNDVIQQRDDFNLTIRTERVDWFAKTFESKGFIDLSRVIDSEREVVRGDFFNSETFFKGLLTDKSSFLVVLDNPGLFVSLEPITRYKYPFTYHTEEIRPIPMMTGSGLLPKYFSRKIINRRLLDISLGIQKVYLNKTTGVNNGGDLYHGFSNRFNPSKLYKGYHLYIRGLVQKG